MKGARCWFSSKAGVCRRNVTRIGQCREPDHRTTGPQDRGTAGRRRAQVEILSPIRCCADMDVSATNAMMWGFSKINDAMLGAPAVRARRFVAPNTLFPGPWRSWRSVGVMVMWCLHPSLSRHPIVAVPSWTSLAARGTIIWSVIVSKVCMLGAPAVRVRRFCRYYSG